MTDSSKQPPPQAPPLDTTIAAVTRTEDVMQRMRQLADDICLAKQQEEHLLSRLMSRHDVWAALRNEKDPHFVAHVQERKMRQVQQQQQQQSKEFFTPKAAPEPAPSQTEDDDEEEGTTASTIGFGEFSNMETDAKRARIRRGLLRQRDKIKSLLQRMKRRRAALLAASTSSKKTSSRK